MKKTVPIVDIFAGPGGLGEGFSSYDGDKVRFKIALSIEKDTQAHQTLELRAFFRQFEKGAAPEEYYQYLGGNTSRKALFEKYPRKAVAAQKEAWLHELNNGDIGIVRRKAGAALKKYKSNHWVLIGGPPCQAYSIVGRARMKKKKKQLEADEKNYLYQHYLRLVADLAPSIFIMENVKGMLTASVKGEKIFDKVLADLERPGRAIKDLDNKKRSPTSHEYDIYSLVAVRRKPQKGTTAKRDKKLHPSDYIIHSEEFGIPQKRHRVILMGIRKDLDPHLTVRLRKRKRVSAKNVLNDLPRLRSGLSKKDSYETWKKAIDSLLTNSVMNAIDAKTRKVMKKEVSSIGENLTRGALRIERKKVPKPKKLSHWFQDNNLEVVCNHESKAHMKSDLWRYYFASCFAKAHGRSPLLHDYPKALLPDHKNATSGSRTFTDRFKVQIGKRPGSTVTSHISQDGHFFIHHDPGQCRAWTVREAARIQSFPDNYFFEGNRTAQYRQVGNAVPPLLAIQIAHVVAEHLKKM